MLETHYTKEICDLSFLSFGKHFFFKLFLVSKYQIHPIKSKSERKKER